MPAELLSVLNRRRVAVECKGETWESSPQAADADASHLEGCTFNAPVASDWLKSLGTTPEENPLSEALLEELRLRGHCPDHAPKLFGNGSCTELQALSRSLLQLQSSVAKEQQRLSSASEDLAKREADLVRQEEALRKQIAEKSTDADAEYPPPEWMEDLDSTINVAIVGNSGVGKSLLINRLRKMKSTASAAAAVGALAPVGVNETTMRPTMYPFEGVAGVRLWDLPGAGTANFPSKTYVKSMGLRYFHRVLVVTAVRFTETELEIIQELTAHGVPYAMVRNKVDLDVWNNKLDNNKDEQETLAEIRQSLQDAHALDNVYLVSSRDGADAFDMPRLLQDMFPTLKQLSADAAPFCPGEAAATGVASWDDAWAMPEAHSQVLSLIQGLWRDHAGKQYLVHGSQVHISSSQGAAVVQLFETPDCVWWTEAKRWWINRESAMQSRKSSPNKLRWSPASLEDRPLVWLWSD